MNDRRPPQQQRRRQRHAKVLLLLYIDTSSLLSGPVPRLLEGSSYRPLGRRNLEFSRVTVFRAVSASKGVTWCFPALRR